MRLKGFTHDNIGSTEIFSRPATMAGQVRMDSAVTIQINEHFNGSGPQAFGGAKSWPTIDLHVPFCVGEEALRDRLSEKLAEVIDQYLSDLENGLGEREL